jgi:hypothetical protein
VTSCAVTAPSENGRVLNMNIGNSSKSSFAHYTIVKELHGTTVLELEFLHKILSITAAEPFAMLKLPCREETMSRTQVAGIQSSVGGQMSGHCLFERHTDVWTLCV